MAELPLQRDGGESEAGALDELAGLAYDPLDNANVAELSDHGSPTNTTAADNDSSHNPDAIPNTLSAPAASAAANTESLGSRGNYRAYVEEVSEEDEDEDEDEEMPWLESDDWSSDEEDDGLDAWDHINVDFERELAEFGMQLSPSSSFVSLTSECNR